MKGMSVTIGRSVIVLCALSLAGCAYTSAVKTGGDVYSRSVDANAPRAAVTDLADLRPNPKHIGQVAALALNEPSTPMNVILTNRIAAQLVGDGFRVEKVVLKDPSNAEEASRVISASGAKIIVTGEMKDFFVKSFDAMMESAKGQGSFSIKVIGADGKILFERPYMGNAEHFIGLTGQFGSDAAIEKTVDACVNALFSDQEFQAVLQSAR